MQTSFSSLKNQLFSFVRKEFYHVLRDKKVLLILFGLPVVQVLLFGFVLSNEVKDSRLVIVDMAKDEASRQLTNKFEASRYFETDLISANEADIEVAFRRGKIKAAIVFPSNFQYDLQHGNKTQLQIITDGTDVNQANTINGYISSIVYNFVSESNQQTVPYRVVPEIRMLYNPQLKGAPNFVPGVMAMVLMLVCVLMTSVSIVREKELGTMEVLLVSPMQPALAIISKALPYLFLSFLNLLIIIVLSVYVLDVPVKGNIFLLISVSTLFIVTCLSLGILISTNTNTQQEAMFVSLIGMLMPTMLLSGFMFPIENMPLALQIVSNIVPSRWYYIIVKDVMIKGAGFESIWMETLILGGMGLFFFAVSMKKFKIRLA